MDSRENEVTTFTLTPDEFGMVKADYVLGDEPSLGTYMIELTVGSVAADNNDAAMIFYQPLKVEEYAKPEYKVEISTSEPYVISGDAFNITVNSDYFFGQPVTNADVNVKIYKQRYDNYYWWENIYSDSYYYSQRKEFG